MQRQHLSTAQRPAGRRSRPTSPHIARPGRARRRATSPPPASGVDRRRARLPRGRQRGLAPGGGLRPRGRRGGRPPGQRRRHRTGCSSSAAVPPGLERLHHVSTCYVSGRYDGEFTEDDLDEGQDVPQPLRVDEVRGRDAGPQGDGRRPARDRSTGPGIVVGDSRTGATQKYDGPYFLATFLRRQPPVARRPGRRPTPTGCASAWSPATSSSTRWTSCPCWTGRWAGPTPSPTPTRRPCASSSTPSPATWASAWSGCRCRWALTRAAGRLGALARAAARACPPRRSTTSPPPPPTPPPTRTTDLAGTGVACPPLRGLRRPAARLHGRAPRARLRGHGLTPTPTSAPRSDDMARQDARGRQRQPDGPRAGPRRARDLPRPAVPDRPARHRRRRRRRRRARPRVGRRRPPPSRSPASARRRPPACTTASSRARPSASWPRPAATPVTDGHAAARRAAGVGGPARRRPRCRATSPTPGPSCSAGCNHDRTTRILREHTAQPRVRRPAAAPRPARPAARQPGAGAGRRRRGRRDRLALRLLPDAVRSAGRPRPARLGRARLARRAARDCDVLVATYDELAGFGLEDLAGKTLITSGDLATERLAELGDRGRRPGRRRDAAAVRRVTVNAAMLEALMMAVGRTGQHAHQRRPARHDRRPPAWSRGCSTRTGPGARAGSRSSSTRCRRSTSRNVEPLAHHRARSRRRR